LRPPSPLPSPDNVTGLYCPIPAGPFAFSAYAPLSSSRELATLQTSLRAVDPFSNELLCVNIATTPLEPGTQGSVYGNARLIFYGTVTLCVVFWLLVAIARLSSAWVRRSGWSRSGFWPSVENVGFVVASAISGEGLSKSPALMRFGTSFIVCSGARSDLSTLRLLVRLPPTFPTAVTPSMRDVFFHTQWCAALAMVAVQWPEFICNHTFFALSTQLPFLTFIFRPHSHADGVVHSLLQYVS
jgi:hypothetical protein